MNVISLIFYLSPLTGCLRSQRFFLFYHAMAGPDNPTRRFSPLIASIPKLFCLRVKLDHEAAKGRNALNAFDHKHMMHFTHLVHCAVFSRHMSFSLLFWNRVDTMQRTLSRQRAIERTSCSWIGKRPNTDKPLRRHRRSKAVRKDGSCIMINNSDVPNSL